MLKLKTDMYFLPKVLTVACFIFLFCFASVVQASGLPTGGKIYMDVEQRGELWYVHPSRAQRTYLSLDSSKLFTDLMSAAKVISPSVLQKIPLQGTRSRASATLCRTWGGLFVKGADKRTVWFVDGKTCQRSPFYVDKISLSKVLRAFGGSIGIRHAILARIKATNGPSSTVRIAPKESNPIVQPTPPVVAPPPDVIAPAPIPPVIPAPVTPTPPVVVPDPCSGVSVPVVPPNTTYVIVTRQMFVSSLTPFVAHKESMGERVAVVDAQGIACTMVGADVPEKIRQYLQQTIRVAPQVKYALMVGAPLQNAGRTLPLSLALTQPWEIPIRYVRIHTSNPLTDGQAPTPTDQYYASLRQDWDPEDGSWQRRFTFHADIVVGRVPATNMIDLNNWIQKTIRWIPSQAPVHSHFVSAHGGTAFNDIAELMYASATHRFIYNRGQDPGAGGDIADIANQQQADIISSASHGNSESITYLPLRQGYSLSKLSPAIRKPSVMFVHGCDVASVDGMDPSLGEHILFLPTGIVAFIGSTRSHADIRFPLFDTIFFHDVERYGDALYQTKENRANATVLSSQEFNNLFMFNLLGDPSLQVVSPRLVAAPLVFDQTVSESTSSISIIASYQSKHYSITGNGQFATPFNVISKSTTVTLPDNQMQQVVLPIDQFYSSDEYYKNVILDRWWPTFSGCDLAMMSCAIRPVFVHSPAWFSCGQLRDAGNGGVLVSIKAHNTIDLPLKYVVIARPGRLQSVGTRGDARVPITLTTKYVAKQQAHSMLDVLIPAGMSVSQDMVPSPWIDGMEYISPSLTVEAFEQSTDRYLGRCSVDPFYEPMSQLFVNRP